MPELKMAAVIPKAMWVGVKVVLQIKKLKKKADKASRIFEKTLKKEGIPPEFAIRFAKIYRGSVPLPDRTSGIAKLFT